MPGLRCFLRGTLPTIYNASRSHLQQTTRGCVTRRRQNKPSNTQEPKQRLTQQRTSARSSANLTKPNQTPSRYTLVKDTTILHAATPQAAAVFATLEADAAGKALPALGSGPLRHGTPEKLHWGFGVGMADGSAGSRAILRSARPYCSASAKIYSLARIEMSRACAAALR